MKMLKHSLGLMLGTLVSTSLSAGIGNALSQWEHKAMMLQNQIDLHSAMSTNNILGSHNSYNSDEYADDGYIRYVDAQQYHSIKEQLDLGARFIELDVHWTLNASDWRYHLVLCHGTSGHTGCSLSDRFLSEGLEEVRAWLESEQSKDQVIILYLEDHSEGQHDNIYEALSVYLGGYIYRSNGCNAIPSNLSKADVLNTGAKVVVWKDGGCANDTNLRNTVFSSLGDIDRVWEDATTLSGLFGDGNTYISASEVTGLFEQGRNLVNLDNFTYNDGRLAASIWSWAQNEPNGGTSENCGLMLESGRWADVNCHESTRIHAFACQNQDAPDNWAISSSVGLQAEGITACQGLGANWRFAHPTNAKQNKALRNAANAVSADRVWLNIHDAESEGDWTSTDNTFPSFNWETIPGSLKQISMSADGELWGVNFDDAIYRRTGASWTQISGRLKHVSAGSKNNIWGVNSNNNIYQWNGSGWNYVPGDLKVISAAADGSVWGVNTGGQIWYKAPGASSWNPTSGNFTYVSSGSASNVWALNANNQVYKWNGSSFVLQNGSLKVIEAAEDGTVMGLTPQGNVVSLQADGSWQQQSGIMKSISVGSATQVAAVDNYDAIWRQGNIWGSLVEQRSGLCMDFPGTEPSNGANVLVWGCGGQEWQKWRYDPVTKLIRNKHRPDYCLDHGGPDEAYNGGKVQMWQCMNHPNLQWEYDGTYIRNVYNTNLVLDAFGTSNGDNIGQWSQHGGANQQWKLAE